MLKLRQGCRVPFPELLNEAYQRDETRIIANVDADKISDIVSHFIAMHNEPLFFILELPSNKKDENATPEGEVSSFHKDIYFIDGCSQSKANDIWSRVSEILINDGLCSFGFGAHYSKDEIMIGKYNVLTLLSPQLQKFDGFFESHNIVETDRLITAWTTFTKDHPGESMRIKTNEKDIFDVVDMLKDSGLYFYQRIDD